MARYGKIALLCIAFAAVLLATGMRQASAYTIDGSDYDSRSLSTRESGTSEAQAKWHGADGADLDAYAWDANSNCRAIAVWVYDLGSTSGDLTIKWSYHVRAEFEVDGDGLAYSTFWFELWSSSGRVGSSSTRTHTSDINKDITVTKTFYNLPSDTYRVEVIAGTRAVSDTTGSSAEADAYYGPLQVTSNWLTIT